MIFVVATAAVLAFGNCSYITSYATCPSSPPPLQPGSPLMNPDLLLAAWLSVQQQQQLYIYIVSTLTRLTLPKMRRFPSVASQTAVISFSSLLERWCLFNFSATTATFSCRRCPNGEDILLSDATLIVVRRGKEPTLEISAQLEQVSPPGNQCV